MESDDDDSYFDHLQEAADRLDDENEVIDPQQIPVAHREFSSEMEYFDHMQQENGKESSLISSENNMIWQSLLRDSVKVNSGSTSGNKAFQCIDLVHDRENPRILLIEQWLLSQLPTSSYAIARLRSRFLVEADSLYLWIDDILHPSTLVLARYTLNESASRHDFDGHIFSSLPSTEDLKLLLVSFLPPLLASPPTSQFPTGVEQFEPSNIGFESIDDRIAYVVQDIVNNPRLSHSLQPRKPINVYTYVVYVLQGSTELLRADPGTVSIAAGYELRRLTRADAAVVDENWRYRHPGSLDFIRKLIQSTPCVGVYESSNGTLVSWGLTYPYGAIGMLFTLENHRRKGLARSLLRYILPLWSRATEWGCAPYCHIDPENDSSRAMFASLGFVKAADQTWLH